MQHWREVPRLDELKPRLGLTEDTRTTDFGLGLLVVILPRMMNSRKKKK